MKKFVTMKLWRSTRQLARVLAAVLGESLVRLVDRLVREEYERKGIELREEDDGSA